LELSSLSLSAPFSATFMYNALSQDNTQEWDHGRLLTTLLHIWEVLV
jgi:hypothetical protein